MRLEVQLINKLKLKWHIRSRRGWRSRFWNNTSAIVNLPFSKSIKDNQLHPCMVWCQCSDKPLHSSPTPSFFIFMGTNDTAAITFCWCREFFKPEQLPDDQGYGLPLSQCLLYNVSAVDFGHRSCKERPNSGAVPHSKRQLWQTWGNRTLTRSCKWPHQTLKTGRMCGSMDILTHMSNTK